MFVYPLCLSVCPDQVCIHSMCTRTAFIGCLDYLCSIFVVAPPPPPPPPTHAHIYVLAHKILTSEYMFYREREGGGNEREREREREGVKECM